MKRNTYKISIDGVEVARKHAWNSAMNEMRNQIRKAIPYGEAELVKTEIDKTDTRKGRFVWQSDRAYVVTIEPVVLPVWIFRVSDEDGLWGELRVEADTESKALKAAKKDMREAVEYGETDFDVRSGKYELIEK